MNENRERLTALRASLGRQVQDQGLPLVDTVFWHNPGPKIGGYLAFQLQMAGCGETGAHRVDLQPRPQRFKSLSELRQHLEREHTNKHWYRGQRRRYQALYRGVIPSLIEAGLGFDAVEFQMESLVPSVYRSFVRSSPATWHESPPLGPPLDAFAAPLRAILRSGNEKLIEVFVQATEMIGLDTIRLLVSDRVNIGLGEKMAAPGTNVSKEIAKLISLAQHYEFNSVMVDVTRNVDIAATFASSDWESGKRAREGGGVIYRFDALMIEKASVDMLKGGVRSPLLGPLALLGVTDVHEIGFDLQRPVRQQGGSLFGLETAAAHFLFQMHGALEAFVFEEDDVGADDIPEMNHLRPADDPGLAVFDMSARDQVEPLTDDEIADGLRRAGKSDKEVARTLSWRRDGIV